MADQKLPEDRATDIARHIATDRLPVDAGAIAMLRDAVSDARREGRAAALGEVAEAWRLFIETDDIDGFRDTLTDLMDAEGLLSAEVPDAS